jgi:hypothetical protein
MTSLSGTLLTLIASDGKETPLDASHADIAILAHFPVCNTKFTVKSGGPTIWLRPLHAHPARRRGNFEHAGVVLEISVEGDFDGQLRIHPPDGS